MMIKIFPFIFILLWSSAFITTKPIIDNSDPFAALAFRFALVALGFFLFSIYSKQKILVSKRNFFESFFSGVLFHGFYLGGVFYSISIGMPTAIAALIVTLQPILTNALSGPILNEKVSTKQWIGVLLGFAGAGLVLGFDVGSKIPAAGLISTIIALLAITFSTLWQKKLSQIFLVSFGAFTILMFLIKNNSASKTVSIFFLIPATSAFMAWLFLNESLTSLDLIGFLITSIGVYIATRD